MLYSNAKNNTVCLSVSEKFEVFDILLCCIELSVLLLLGSCCVLKVIDASSEDLEGKGNGNRTIF